MCHVPVCPSMHAHACVSVCRLHDAFFAAAQEAGLTANPDFNEWNRAQVRGGALLQRNITSAQSTAQHAASEHAQPEFKRWPLCPGPCCLDSCLVHVLVSPTVLSVHLANPAPLIPPPLSTPRPATETSRSANGRAGVQTHTPLTSRRPWAGQTCLL